MVVHTSNSKVREYQQLPQAFGADQMIVPNYIVPKIVFKVLGCPHGKAYLHKIRKISCRLKWAIHIWHHKGIFFRNN